MVYTNLIHRLVLLISLLVAITSFFINIAIRNISFCKAAFNSLCILFITGIIFLIAFKAIENILYRHLHEQYKKNKTIDFEDQEA
ncbi:hypothetical protein AAEX28_06130 [Lentisphaerota bacterium WC36G]|nr:hypothetical protein LJT99_08990 [Lentisphaerae bacterium WC36]